MCIMEVRPGQHHSTITQACAHNIDTVVGDLEMSGKEAGKNEEQRHPKGMADLREPAEVLAGGVRLD